MYTLYSTGWLCTNMLYIVHLYFKSYKRSHDIQEWSSKKREIVDLSENDKISEWNAKTLENIIISCQWIKICEWEVMSMDVGVTLVAAVCVSQTDMTQ